MNFLKVDRSLYSQKCSLVQITDTVDATETVLYRDIECSPFPIGKEHMERSFHHTPAYRHGDAGRRYVIYLKAGSYTPTPAMRGKSCWQSCIVWHRRSTTGTKPQFHEILLELP